MTHSAEKGLPTCRSCWLDTLTDYERERALARPITSCVYLCPEHQAAMDRVMSALPNTPFFKADPLKDFVFQTVEEEERCPNDGQSLSWHLATELDARGNPRTNTAFLGCNWSRGAPPGSTLRDMARERGLNPVGTDLDIETGKRVTPPEKGDQ